MSQRKVGKNTFMEVVVAMCFSTLFGLIVGGALWIAIADLFGIIGGICMYCYSLDIMLNGTEQ